MKPRTFQHVNNIVYFRYFESARFAYSYKLDLIDLMTRTGIGPKAALSIGFGGWRIASE
jgi:acyl-CoA thioesterase FadM